MSLEGGLLHIVPQRKDMPRFTGPHGEAPESARKHQEQKGKACTGGFIDFQRKEGEAVSAS